MGTHSATFDAEDGNSPGYSERFRPQFHYSPRRNWMNDPNGLVYHDGTYHLFHQYNPKGATWGHMSWAHATSTDLIHWTHEPLALAETDREMIFSGSVVVDAKRTTGFGGDNGDVPLVAIYTSHFPDEGPDGDEAQSLAYSTDGGTTWTAYDGNPVLEHADPDFRDPNVFWYEPASAWVMTVALPTQRRVQFYQSSNLKEWTPLSEFGPAGSTTGIWECPALFPLPVENEPDEEKWVLQVDVNPGAVAGGSGAQYFVGTFDGVDFSCDETDRDAAPRWVDYGPDFYAAIPWNNLPQPPSRVVWIGWLNNWQYAEKLPTSPWRGALSVPRELTLQRRDGRLHLVQKPIRELKQLRHDPVRFSHLSLSAQTERDRRTVGAGASMDVTATFDQIDADAVGLRLLAGSTEETVVGYDARSQVLFVDRSSSGKTDIHEGFAARHEAPLSLSDRCLDLRVLIDRSCVEVFANDGQRVFSHRVFPDPRSTTLSVFAENGTARVRTLHAWQLRSIWSKTPPPAP